jgi:hypothetical protein
MVLSSCWTTAGEAKVSDSQTQRCVGSKQHRQVLSPILQSRVPRDKAHAKRFHLLQDDAISSGKEKTRKNIKKIIKNTK